MDHETQFLSKFEEDSKSIGFLFMRAYSTWHSQIKNCLKKQSITHPQFIVMATTAYLSQNVDEVTQIMISKKTNIDVMTISQIINKLEEKRFIIRNNSLKDSRARSIKISYLPKDIHFYIVDLPLRGKKVNKPMYNRDTD
ncbi:hypothetical protein A9G29_07795 [Gilliamella sp. Fer2-1]|jgi:MarR family transcriptional regulator, temperature-dependent positive regulator of motility|nr:hypothetical protein A9G29_07795 [Gilliamella apicola]